jgi:hypothetical protein
VRREETKRLPENLDGVAVEFVEYIVHRERMSKADLDLCCGIT